MARYPGGSPVAACRTPIFMPTLFLLHYSGEKIISSVLFWLVTAVLGVYFILVAVSQFTDAFYYVTPDNRFLHGPLWAFLLTPLTVCMILNTMGLFIRIKDLPKKVFYRSSDLFSVYDRSPHCAYVL